MIADDARRRMKETTTERGRHTAGPWEVNRGSGTITGASNGTTSATVTVMPQWYRNHAGDGTHATQNRLDANASRIVDCVNACEGLNPAAVPDLLEALHGFIGSTIYGHLDDEGKEQWRNAVRAARAAIDKATK